MGSSESSGEEVEGDQIVRDLGDNLTFFKFHVETFKAMGDIFKPMFKKNFKGDCNMLLKFENVGLAHSTLTLKQI